MPKEVTKALKKTFQNRDANYLINLKGYQFKKVIGEGNFELFTEQNDHYQNEEKVILLVKNFFAKQR